MSVLLRMLDLFITLDSLGKSRQVVWHLHHLSPGFVINMMYVHAQQLVPQNWKEKVKPYMMPSHLLSFVQLWFLRSM